MLYLRLIILSVKDDVPVNSESFFVTDFMNLKIKPAQSFRCAHKDKVCLCVFIRVNARTCMRICICTVFLKKEIVQFSSVTMSIRNIAKREKISMQTTAR
jgi:hypothetical protein